MEERSVVEQAAIWVAELKEINAAKSAKFGEWLAESPRHVEEFLLVAALEKELEGIDPQKNMEVSATHGSENVFELGRLAVFASRSPDQRVRRGWIAAVAGVVISVSVASAWWAARLPSYSTATGEQRSLELSDGSVVHLNAQSHVNMHFSDQVREVELLHGEALFKVARDPSRPFRVRAGGSVIQALGTEFNVDYRASETTISVIEGLVQVASSRLAAGEQMRIDAQAKVMKRKQTDVGRVIAWRQRRFIFLDDRLIDVAAEFNRYNRAPKIIIEDEAAAGTTLSGVFDADDPESLLLFLSGVPKLASEIRGDKVVIRARDASSVH